MKSKLLGMLVLCTICGVRLWAQMPLLVSPDWLRTHMHDANIVLVYPDFGPQRYEQAHIPGARFLNTQHVQLNNANTFTDIPTTAVLDSVLSSLGIAENSWVVLCGALPSNARVFMTLEYAGLRGRVGILDGGINMWRAQGGAVTTEKPQYASTVYKTRPDSAVLATAGYLQARLGHPQLQLLDVRTRAEYLGDNDIEGLPRYGHLPGARHHPVTHFENPATGYLKTPKELEKQLQALGLKKTQEVVVYCTVGMRASIGYFIGRYLGYRVRMYDGSSAEWSRLPAEQAPMVKGSSSN